MPSTIIILTGPGGFAFNKETVLKANQGFKNLGLKTSVIGNGKDALTISDIEGALLSQIADAEGQVILFILAHGEVNKEREHIIMLGDDYSIKTFELFDKLKKIGKPIDIFSTACHGGAAHGEAQSRLPSKSTYVSLVPANELANGFDIKQLISIMLSGEIKNSSLTAEQLLILYLTKALQTRAAPSISTITLPERLNNQLKFYLSQRFTDLKKKRIYESLQPLVEKSLLDRMIAKIEKARSEYNILAADFGLSLAVCYAASGKMLVEKSSFTVNKMPAVSIKNVPELKPAVAIKEAKLPKIITKKKTIRNKRLSLRENPTPLFPMASFDFQWPERNQSVESASILTHEIKSKFSFFSELEQKVKPKAAGLESQVAKKLSLLFGKNCDVVSLIPDWHIVDITPEQSYETMESYSAILNLANLSTEAQKAITRREGFKAAPAKLQLHGSLNAILETLKIITKDISPVAASAYSPSFQ